MPVALIENPEMRPVLVSGATSPISAIDIADYARSGRQTFCVLTLDEKRAGNGVKRFQDTVMSPLVNKAPYEGVDRLVVPIPIFANIRNPESVDLILETIRKNTHPGQKIHFDSFAAAGYRAIGSGVLRIAGNLARRTRRGEMITEDDLIAATEHIRSITMSGEPLRESVETNHTGPIRIYNGLQREGFLDEDSVTAQISSDPTDDYVNGLLINAFYGGISVGKSGGETEQEELCIINGQGYFKLICPVAARTSAGDFAISMRDYLASIKGEGNVPKIQTVTIEQAAQVIIRELRDMHRGSVDRIRKRYLGLDGSVYLTKPADIRTPMLDYF